MFLRASFDLGAGHVQSKIANPGPGVPGKIISPGHDGPDFKNIGPGSGVESRGWGYIGFIFT